ncbi:MAG: 1,4-dihydroxy-2-naphthoate octaprenyltransferase [Dysgonamonadaceae bacterium]|jgi:1,4-dihydroxy-2-naphthoate octaprenyltransferase|nr:1,4-dihydroxy-2-naphthoate octaprenyltransferase [Dysgonamonadaceae bacterium]
MKTSTFKHWYLAARPRTLSASVMPVVVACVLAWREGRFLWIPALICFLFAIIAQVVSNFFNDYSDFVKGSDRPDRLGPQRAVAGGWIKASDMLMVSILLMTCGCLLGLALVYYAGWQILLAGIAVCIGAFAYSAGPYPLAYKGWGDVCVVLFYGIIPVGYTYYVQTLTWTPDAVVCGLAMGFVTTNILVANNYRDREQDLISGKRTTIVIFGEKFGRYFYLFNGILAVGVCLFFISRSRYWAAFLPLFYLIPHLISWQKMTGIRRGEALNLILAESARNVIIFGILLSIGIGIS